MTLATAGHRPLGHAVTAAGQPARLSRLQVRLADTDGAPSELRLFKAGRNDTTKGTFYFTEASAAAVMAGVAAWGNELSSDYEHAALLEAAPEGAPASSWYELEIRTSDAGPELWAVNIRWTERARAFIEAKEYRYLSPAFYADSAGVITGYINFALTNIPATIAMDALIAARHATAQTPIRLGISLDQVLTDIRAQLAPTSNLSDAWLAEFTTDSVILETDNGRTYLVPYTVEGDTVTITAAPVEVRRAWIPVAPPEGATMEQETLTLLGLTTAEPAAPEIHAAVTRLAARATAAEALSALVPAGQDPLGTITAWRDAAARVEALSARVRELERQTESAELQTLLDAAQADGRLTPATRASLTQAFTTPAGLNLAALKSYLEATPRQLPTGAHREPNGSAPTATGRPDTRGKAWADLGNMERHALRLTDPAEFDRLLSEHRAAHP